ncbi:MULTISPECIES: hypothetical protein [Pseudoalteromonas]|uniref:Uncharacterized protein n=1 Tax=Pseudoalteromonas amylolytica TaxID=1859457 RepID=A0A1S1N0H9_9GAMM|nr:MULTISPECIES: hypothetical protein [Pseudoalteromonas]OHU89193.1 hypothetical protein BFC16_06030 [Pseudoalteromonas sp. JW3]OHU92093.1 hypothetical protein BET10_07135 [Pseudoalteromonas amylolytica]
MANNSSDIDLTASELPAEENAPTKPLVLFPEDYYSDIQDLDLTPEQANELLSTLWNIMSTMVNIGWGVDTVQIVLPELFNSDSSKRHNLHNISNSEENDNEQ